MKNAIPHSAFRNPHLALFTRSEPQLHRRGVLLLVVLSMLVLFMLIGTAFLMSSSQDKVNATNAAKAGSRGNLATKELDRALLQLLRDTDNPYSVVRYHSLLRDMYGTQGFQGVVYSPDPAVAFDPNDLTKQVTRFSGALAGTPAVQLGPTGGQFIDIYVRQLGWDTTANASLDDPLTTASELSGTTKLLLPDLRHVLKLDRNVIGQAQLQQLPLSKGYYNGSLLTITSGAAAGQTGRVVDYEYLGDIQPIQTNTTVATYTRLFRFRVMAFQRADGQPLQIGSRAPEISDLAGNSFIVNGRAYGGTGVGYNPLAGQGQPKLSALQLFPTDAGLTEFVGAEIALLPNSAYFNPISKLIRVGSVLPASAPMIPDPFFGPIPVAQLGFLNDPNTLSFVNYPTFAGPGDMNESYDAADYNNIWLALQTVTPRSQGRVVQTDGTFSATDPALDPSKFLRFDLEDVPLPSFHRPELVNFWNHRMMRMLVNPNGPFAMSADAAALAVVDPYPGGTLRGGLDPKAAALITAIKRQSSMRPLHEDHPHFDGSNPFSVPMNLPSSVLDTSQTTIGCPCSQLVGPWDVDNDNDGVMDSIWIDLGDPVQQAEDGTRYKALYAIMILDMDSRLNVNAHGLADEVVPPSLDVTRNKFYDPSILNTGFQPGNLAHDATNLNPALLRSTLQLPRGSGYGPAETSLRPVFRAPWDTASTPVYGNRSEAAGPIDDYAAIFRGRLLQNGGAVSGKYGLDFGNTGAAATPGTNYQYVTPVPPSTPLTSAAWFTGERATPGLAAQIKFFDYPWSSNQWRSYQSAFGTLPDLKGRYSVGLGYAGQPVYEVNSDVNPNTAALAPNQQLPFNLLAQSPYELDLSRAQRRDKWGGTYADANTAFNSSVDYTFTGGPTGLSDDAPFSASDLEKILRAWDSDQGTLPSRLWDCVSAFDPQKLASPYGDPNRVKATSLTAFGSANNNAEILATAQQIAGINRRLITTDSYTPPVSSQTPPAWVRDSAATFVPAYGATAEEVFSNLTGTEFSKARLVDLLAYRFQANRLVRYGLYDANNNLNGVYNAKDPSQQALLGQAVGQLTQQLLAPELVAGLRMDVNRPLGDGVDNNANSVVDDPLEAGEPFLDINGNGKCDDGTNGTPVEPFIDLDGNNAYLAPLDKLWRGLTSEPIEFDYTNGVAVPVYKGGIAGGVRNLESQGRQQCARNLYCLMLLLVDENYIAPWDENDPQIMTWMESEKKKLTSATPPVSAAQADLIVKRKNTCRAIAQWAINSVDMRDSDVIMTPFEYDENPWDGWGTFDNIDPANPVFVPFDGDPSTDENKGETIDWVNISTTGGPKKITTLAAAEAPTAPNQTRGIVWGAERPELLITETLALHDRRTEDLPGANSGDHDELDGTANDKYRDTDMDQRLRPRGSLFVEVYNPWSAQGQYPAELYTKLDTITNYQPSTVPQQEGVELGRLSNFADDNGILSTKNSDAANGIKRSPVWRMIVVEDWPEERNRDSVDDARNDVKRKTAKPPAGYKSMETAMKAWKPTDPTPPPYHAPNPDFTEVFNAGFLPTRVAGQTNQFNIEYPYVEREFYFTTDKSPKVSSNDPTKASDYDYSATSFKLRIPDRSILVGGVGSTLREQTQKFLSLALDKTSTTQPVIAPVMPGRYGVIGSAGTQYATLPNCFTTTIGREDSSKKNTNDSEHLTALKKTRRILLVPDKDPNKPQVVVASNGGDPKDEVRAGTPATADPTTLEIGRDNETINNKGVLANITDLDNNGLPDTTSAFYNPPIAIPIDGMNISEPAWGWTPREAKAAEEEDALNGTKPKPTYKYNATASNGEGSYGAIGSNSVYSYDKPFDTAGELVRTGTTANYRSIHLQRLANPLVPWNPPAGQFKDSAGKDMNKPNLPINPYLTVDTASVNMTAFNGPSEQEHVVKPERTYTTVLRQSRPWVPGSIEIDAYLKNVEAGTQAWYFRSSERGAWSRLNMAGQAANPKTSPPQRVLWAQEPAMIDFRKKPGVATENQVLDLLPGRNMTMRADEISPDAETKLNVSKNNHVNMVLKHSLGFGNESFGLLYDAEGSQGAKSTPPVAAAIGAPAPGDFTWDSDGSMPADVRIAANSTNPWLSWANRPYVSSEELLNVPMTSQSTMLRMFSTVDPSLPAANRPNPYGLTELGTSAAPVANTVRWAVMQAPFGQLANVFAASAVTADVVRDNAGVPVLDASGNVQPYGAPNLYRILDYVQVPSRFVGTDTMLNAETFNDAQGADTVGTDITGPTDPRYAFQPPFNKVSRERDPGKVNLNTVTGRHAGPGSQIWSEVYDGIMHRTHDANPSATQLGQFGPAWRDVVLSRKGYAQFNAGSSTPVEKSSGVPDVYQFGLNPFFPTMFANPFRSSDAGDLVPLPQMMQYGVDASLERVHPRNRGTVIDANGNRIYDSKLGDAAAPIFGDTRDAGFANDGISVRGNGAIPNDAPPPKSLPLAYDDSHRDTLPLFSETRGDAFVDTDRNPAMKYQPMTRLGNLVTDRSGVFAIWITVGYFEVESAPGWDETRDLNNNGTPDGQETKERFGGDITIYNRVYPDGYMLGRELGSDTGDVKRPRGFYIIDRTEEVGFKPGEDLNVEKLIRLRRRIE